VKPFNRVRSARVVPNVHRCIVRREGSRTEVLMIKHLKLCGVVALAGVLAACAQTQPRYGYSGSQPVYGGAQPVYNNNAPSYPAPVYDSSNGAYPSGGYNQTADGSMWGTVTRVDNLGTKNDTGLGAVIGAGVGAIAGNQIGRGMNDAKTTGTVVGAVGGGLVGHAIEHNQNKNNTMQRVYVRMDNGTERYWDVPASQIQPGVGQRLRIQNDQLFAN
jgi:outer membrane lipoprotein SlyB